MATFVIVHGAWGGAWSWNKFVVPMLRKAGHTVDDIDDIRKLDLQVIDRVKPKLGLAYTAGGTVEGAAAGFAVSGGELLATAGGVFGVGAGGAPGAAGSASFEASAGAAFFASSLMM